MRLWPARRLLPAPVVARLGALGLDEYGARSRLAFISEAFRVWLDRPLLGAGGGA